MVINLVLTGMYDIGINKEKFLLNGTKADIKDVSCIRYRLEKYTETECKYIEKMMKKFNSSTHIAEVNMYPGFADDVNNMADRFDNLAIFLYLSVSDEDVTRSDISDYYKGLLEEAREAGVPFDRIMIKDLSSTLFTVAANRMKDSIRNITSAEESEIGFCQSPMSRYDGNACLTAMRARELAAKYNENDSCALPSAHHECKNSNGCGCIKYTLITANSPAPEDKPAGKPKADTQKKEKSSDSKADKPQEKKKSIPNKVFVVPKW